MHFLLTRPKDDSTKLAQSLIALGHRIQNEPLLAVQYAPPQPIKLTHVQALIFTSANGVRAYVRTTTDRNISCFCVGATTAEQARAAGFTDLSTADGNVESLADLIQQKCDPADGTLLHICGKDVAGNLAERLELAGFHVIGKPLYRAVKATALSEETRQMILSGTISHMPFYSPRTAQTFIELIQAAGLQENLTKITALCLSPAVADMISLHRWGKILIAKHPDSSHLFQLIDIKLEENRQ